jgi:hypothetical protein
MQFNYRYPTNYRLITGTSYHSPVPGGDSEMHRLHQCKRGALFASFLHIQYVNVVQPHLLMKVCRGLLITLAIQSVKVVKRTKTPTDN